MRDKPLNFTGFAPGPDFDRAKEMMYTPFQYIDIDLDAAASNQVFNVSGDFLYVDPTSTGSVTMELNNQYNDPAAPFMISSGFALNALFKQLKLSWLSQPGMRIRLIYSTGASVIPALSGFIQTIDGAFFRTLSQTAFLGTGQCPAVAGQYSHVQLWNAPASGRNVVVESVSLGSAVASSIYVVTANTALTTAYSAGVGKYVGGPVSSAWVHIQNNAALLGLSYMLGYQVAAGAVQVVNFREPVVLPPGFGITLQCQTVNAILNGNFEFFETPI